MSTSYPVGELGRVKRIAVGLDAYEHMLARAVEATGNDRNTYRGADLGHLDAGDLLPASFDVAYSSLALKDVADAAALFERRAGAHRRCYTSPQLVDTIQRAGTMLCERNEP